MQLKDFDNMYRKLTQNEKQGHLMLLDAPTGSGKSYSVIRFLCHQADKDPKFRSFFVTDQKKNLPAQENLMTVWCANHSRSSFFKRVAVIRSLEDTVQLILNEAESGRIPEELLNSKIRDLLAALKKKQAIYQQANKLDIHTSSVWRELNDTEYQFRQELAEKLADLAEADKALDAHSQVIIQHYVATQSNEICNWINRVYPTIEIERRQILMLTTDKFIRSYTPFFMRNSIPFRFAPALTNSLVVLDEFDSTKTTLLNQKIEDTMNASADLLGLFRTIHQGLKWHEKQIPVALQQVLEKQPRLDGMLKLADQYTESFKLSYLYRTKETGQNDSFLIHTPQYTIISNQRRWHSYLNSQKNSVELDYTGEDSLHFTEMLGKIGRFIRQFVQVMFYCAQNYAKERNAKLPSNSNGITTREACTTIYDALGFSRAQSDVLMNMDVGVIHGERPTTAIQDDHRYQFQNEGLYLYHFMNAEQHDLRTDINVAFLTVTPERYLLEIVKKANVLGLSATAKVPTVLDNYDLDYLHQRLGDEGYMDGRTVLTEKTKTEFDLKRRYQQAAVDVTAIGSSTQETIRDILAVRYDGSFGTLSIK